MQRTPYETPFLSFRSQAGFSILEVVVACVILTLSLGVTIAWISTSSKRSSTVKIKEAYLEVETEVSTEVSSRVQTFFDIVSRASPACRTDQNVPLYPKFAARWGAQLSSGIVVKLLTAAEFMNLDPIVASVADTYNNALPPVIARCKANAVLYPTPNGTQTPDFSTLSGGAYFCLWLDKASTGNSRGIATMQPVILEARYQMYQLSTDAEVTCGALPNIALNDRVGKLLYSVYWFGTLDTTKIFTSLTGLFAYGN